MMFGMFKKTDPVCGMKEENDKGISDGGNWFCSEKCLKEYNKSKKAEKKQSHGHGCCP